MKTIKDIENDFNLDCFSTGGGCSALGGDLNVNQAQILITSNDTNCPSDNDDNFLLGVYPTPSDTDDYIFFETDNVNHLYTLIEAAFTLWGN